MSEGCKKKYAGAGIRAELEKDGLIESPKTLKDALGRERPRKHKEKSGDSANSAESPEEASSLDPDQTTLEEHIEAAKENGSVGKSVGSKTVIAATKEEKAEDSNNDISVSLTKSSAQTRRATTEKRQAAVTASSGLVG